jgi:hypothetical protein
MQSANSAFPDGIASGVVSSQFEVCLAYQDLSTGLLARRFLSHLLQRSEIGNEFGLTLWNFSMFHLPEIRDQAALNASASDLTILSLRGDTALDRETENWLKQWIARRTGDECALAVLIHHGVQLTDAVGHTLFWLQQITRPTRVRLFVGFMPPASSGKEEPSSSEPQPEVVPPYPGGNLPNPLDIHPEGGLNE